MTTRKSSSKSGRRPSKSARQKPRAKSDQTAPPPDGTQQAEAPELPQSDPKEKPFNPETLDRTVIAIPLLRDFKDEEARQKREPDWVPESYKIIIDLNLEFRGGRDEAREWVIRTTTEIIEQAGTGRAPTQCINLERSRSSAQYVFASLESDVIRELVKRDILENAERREGKAGQSTGTRAIYHVWPDFRVRKLINRSASTVKADAAHASFSAFGEGIVWAVMDTGVDLNHEHFAAHRNLVLKSPLDHMDFTGEGRPREDPDGHGTHVAGIIAGELRTRPASGDAASESGRKAGSRKGGAKGGKRKDESPTIRAYVRSRDEQGETNYDEVAGLDAISGMAPRCKILNMRVLDSGGNGDASAIIEAISKVQEINGYGRRLLIHGVNLSLGNDFDPEWFACGQSPLCVEVNRLVSSGVVVVVAAGNSGYGSLQTKYTDVVSAGLSLTINDPGNADKAITVGSTHRDMPHIYGVSYFSSKGPTGDGRLKPDLVAPGEKIVSCAAGAARERFKQETRLDCNYIEDSGTSMAAPHVSGVIAAFLSVRREFIGQPERVKQLFLTTATDLGRERYFQGHGLVDLMRAIQSV